jgi:hypothetical protein
MKHLLFILLILLSSPALAQEAMANPTTGEPGAWIPRYMQVDHLRLEVNLKACQDLKANQQQQLNLKNEQITDTVLALDEEKAASKSLTEALAITQQELEQADANESRLRTWAWATGVAAVVTTTILILVVTLR